MRLKTASLLCLIMFVVLTAFPLSSHADVTLTIQSEGKTSNILIKDTLVRMSGDASGSDNAGEIIFNAKKQELIALDPERKEAAVMNEADLQKMGNQLGNMMAQMQAQMQNMSPEQRQMMQQMMGGAFPQAAPKQEVKLKVIKTGEMKVLLGKKCSRIIVERDGEKAFEYWVAPKNSLEGGPEVVQAFASLGEFFSGLFDALKKTPMKQMLENPYAAMEQIDGVPLETVQYKNGKAERVTTIVTLTKESLSEEKFAIPSGFKTIRLADSLPG
jgi:hypothetical protein